MECKTFRFTKNVDDVDVTQYRSLKFLFKPIGIRFSLCGGIKESKHFRATLKEHVVRMTDSVDLLLSFHCLCDAMESEWTIECKQGNLCAVGHSKQQTECRWCLPGGL